MTDLVIRPAIAVEAGALSDLCMRSKAHWGYDRAFMEASRDALTITPTFISGGRVLVAEHLQGEILGIATAEPLDADGTFDLVHLFVEPRAIGTGVGRRLFDALAALLRREGGRRLMILADPHAEDFYRRIGARRVGDAPSESIPGRKLPLLEFALA